MSRVANPEHPTRARMLQAATRLFYEHGVRGTSVDDVLAASKTGKSQFYHFFSSKERLIFEVIQFHRETYFAPHMAALDKVQSWPEAMVCFQSMMDQVKKEYPKGGCPIGSIANELLSDGDELLRREIKAFFDNMLAHFARAYATLRAKGILRQEADPDSLALYSVSMMQGTALMAKMNKSDEPLDSNFHEFMSHIRAYAALPEQIR